MNPPQHPLFSDLEAYLDDVAHASATLTEDRRARLREIGDYIRRQSAQHRVADLVFICTHNSRRSHFGQVWAQALAFRYGFDGVGSYSGGTEATTFHPNAIRALREAGFEITLEEPGRNPRYRVRFAAHDHGTEAWSKVYSDPANPLRDFCAIMTCGEADEACPIVLGAAMRVSLPYKDPKIADGTPEEAEIYRLRCRQIAGEMRYVFTYDRAGIDAV
jgi:hypothetical protein